MVVSRGFPHPTLSLASEQTKYLKISHGPQRGDEENGFGELGPPDFTEIHHRGNISSIRAFDQIRDPEIPITFRPPI